MDCKPLSETFSIISVMTTGTSTDNHAQIEITAAATDLPLPSSDYSIVVASTSSLKMEARSTLVSIENPVIELVFPIVRENAASSLAEVRDSVVDILTKVLQIESSRMMVDLSGSGVHDLVRARIQPTNSLASQAARLFVHFTE